MASLPGQHYLGVARDRRGNALEGVVVDVLEAGTANLLGTATSDSQGEYLIDLSSGVFDGRLVDLRFTALGYPVRLVEDLMIAGAEGVSLWTSDGAIAANTLVKASVSTDNRVVQLQTIDSPDLIVGVALNAAGGAGTAVRVASLTIPVQVASDGSGTIARGARIEMSTTVAGRVRQYSAGQALGSAFTAAPATLGALVKVMSAK